MSVALNPFSDAAARSWPAARPARPLGHLPPTPVVCLADGLILVSVERLADRTSIRSLLLDGGLSVAELVSAYGETRHFVIGRLANVPTQGTTIASLQLISEVGGQVAWSNAQPLAPRTESAAIEKLLEELSEGDRPAAIMALLKAISVYKLHVRPQLAMAIATAARQQAAAAESWFAPLTPHLLYARLSLPQLERPAAATTARIDAFFVTPRGMTPAASPTALVTGGNLVHLLLPAPIEPDSLLIGLVAGRIVAATVAPSSATTSGPPIEEIIARTPGDSMPLKLYLLARCAEIQRREPSEPTLNAGNLLWAFTTFTNRAYVRPEMDFGVSIENILAVPGKGILVVGWLWDPQGLLDGLFVRDGLSRVGRIDATMYRYDRADVREVFKAPASQPPGFVLFQPFEFAEELWPTYQVHGVLKGGTVIDLATDLKASQRFFAKPESLLNLVPPHKFEKPVIEKLAPAIAHLQTKSIKRSGIGRVVQYGTAPKDPVMSIVVPLYKRIDHARHQIVHFANDPEFADIELIYVLDWPDLEAPLDAMLASLSRIYQRAVTLAVMKENCGFAGATNAGASIARGRYLLMLNSDVIPDKPGWCSKLWSVLERDPKIGAVGARLLYEDDTIQHAGIAYELDGQGNLRAVHPAKGFRVGHPGEPKSGPVPAVTAACMAMRTAQYHQLGGLSQDYVIGDFEDSDLCMKIASAPMAIWYCADATLYHLERQSMGTDGRYTQVTWRYNLYVHQQRWGRMISRIQAQFPR